MGEPDGVWFGKGLAMLDLDPGQTVTAEQMRAVYGRLEHWKTDADGNTVMELGSRPKTFKSLEQRIERALAKEPLATPERQEEIRREVKASNGPSRSVGYYDATFTPVKSVSVYRAALAAAGRDDLAAAVTAAHDQAVREALAFIEANVADTRVGKHATVKLDDGTRKTVGAYERIDGLVVTLWGHSTSRDGDPHLHTHAAILNRVRTKSGKIMALDGQQFKRLKGAADLIYERRLEELVGEATGAVFATRPDGATREILGVDRELCEESSSRSAAIQARLDHLLEDYRREHGREPGQRAMAAMRREAWAHTRNPKVMEDPVALADRYADKHGRDRLADQVDNVAEAARQARENGVDQPSFATEDELLAAAVQRTQERYATWDETALALELNRLMGEVQWGTGAPAEVQRMIERALAPDGPGDVVALTARERVWVPPQMRHGDDPDAAAKIRPSARTRYSTRAHLAAEKSLVAQATSTSGVKLTPERAVAVRSELAKGKLAPDQYAAVTGVLTSGRAADVLVGPAGTGKSTTVGELSRVWQREIGPVLGVATSQRATDVLRDLGMDGLNVAAFSARYLPQADGRPARQELPKGTLLVVDEAGMADTDKLLPIARLVAKRGGKTLYTGDHEQIAAVGAGGLLRLLAEDASPYRLVNVFRFRHHWEREASLQFRAGDTAAIAAYEEHGRLRGGTREEMTEAAMRGYLTDYLAGKDTVLITRTNSAAADLSRRVRDELVALGRVHDAPLAQLADDNVCGVGDLLQARRIDHQADTDNGAMLVNREMLTVLGVTDDGRLVVRREDGTEARLESDYVAEHVTLGYAGTTNSVQGRTVDSGHGIVEPGMSRNNAYVANTRGREANYLYVVSETPSDAHDLEPRAASATDTLAEILTNDGGQVSAAETWRAELTADDRLDTLLPQWELVARPEMAQRHHQVLTAMLGDEQAEKIASETRYEDLLGTLARAEMSGHDVSDLLTAAVPDPARSLRNANSVTAVLCKRVDKIMRRTSVNSDVSGDDRNTSGPDNRTDQNRDQARGPAAPSRWTGRHRGGDNEPARYAEALGALMDQRAEMITRSAVLAPPDWVLATVGPVPTGADDSAREQWAAKVGAIGSYRELAGISPDDMGIGSAPSLTREPARHVAWHAAWDALGRPKHEADHQTATEADLRATIDRWRREQQWAPYPVAEQLQKATTLAEEYRREAAHRWAQVGAEVVAHHGEITAETEQLEQDARRADRLKARFDAAASRFERLGEARARWAERTRKLADQARIAVAELRRREVPVNGEPVQTALLDERGGYDTPYARQMGIDVEAAPSPAPQPDDQRTPGAQADEHHAEVVADQPSRGDYGSGYDLDTVPEADHSYPAPAEHDPDQLELFPVEEPAPDVRVSAGRLSDDDAAPTVREAELRARLTDAADPDREMQAAVQESVARAVQAEIERAEAREQEEAERRRRERMLQDRDVDHGAPEPAVAGHAASPEPEIGL